MRGNQGLGLRNSQQLALLGLCEATKGFAWCLVLRASHKGCKGQTNKQNFFRTTKYGSSKIHFCIYDIVFAWDLGHLFE